MMYSRLQKAAVWSGASAVVFAVPVLIFSLICRSGTVRRVGGNYISIPFFLMISAAMILTGICILAAIRKLGRGQLFSRLVFAVFSVGMAVGGICLLTVKVGAPLRDISYLGQPRQVSLEKVSFLYSGLGDSPSIQIRGEDSQGREEIFSIGQQEYDQGQALVGTDAAQQEGEEKDQGLTAEIRYLPYSKTVVDVDLEES